MALDTRGAKKLEDPIRSSTHTVESSSDCRAAVVDGWRSGSSMLSMEELPTDSDSAPVNHWQCGSNEVGTSAKGSRNCPTDESSSFDGLGDRM